MLKGDVFNKQYFSSNTFALFVDTFLASRCGIINGYKNSMDISNTTNQITVSSGAVCIRGRFAREDSYTTINVNYQSNMYCILVIEVDLDKINTPSEFEQASYKVIAGENTYPSLTQTNIVMNEAGIYQYELARFTCNSSGITNFEDRRTFLDFNSIYAEIRQHIADIDSEKFVMIPIGGGIDYYGDTAPANFMFADGSEISRTEYASLFAVLGIRYGAGNGFTTFNLPDKRERVSVAYKNGSTNGTANASFGTLGARGGEFKHVLTIPELASHSHSVNDPGHSHGVNDPGHNHNMWYTSGSGGQTGDWKAAKTIFNSDGDALWGDMPSATNISIYNSPSGIWLDHAGDDEGHNNLQPYIVCNYIIRVK